MNPLLAGAQWVIGGIAWAVIARGAWVTVRHWRHAARQAGDLAHTRQQPPCGVDHLPDGLRLAWHLRSAFPPAVTNDQLAALCRALIVAGHKQARRHGKDAPAVVFCDLHAAIAELTAADRDEVPR